MREIKFRIWDKDYECMWNGSELYLSFFKNEIYVAPWDSDRGFDEYVLMQYVCNDTFDKEIYEGDIIKRTDLTPTENHYGKEEVGLVEYKNAQFILRISKDDYYEISSDGLFNFDMADYEVIGNIYENPELLED